MRNIPFFCPACKQSKMVPRSAGRVACSPKCGAAVRWSKPEMHQRFVAMMDRRWSAEGLFKKHVIKQDGCWAWGGSVSGTGYAIVSHKMKAIGAHRVSYELHKGPIPAGLVIDHLCRNRICTNPDHLEPVTNAENLMRGGGPQAINKAKTECIHGHPLSGANLYLWGRGRGCRACRKRNSERFCAKKKLRNGDIR